VFGASDKDGAYPTTDPVDPVDIQATLLRGLGLDADVTIRDHVNQPPAICTGRVVPRLL